MAGLGCHIPTNRQRICCWPHTRQKSNTGADISQPVKNLKANVNRLHVSLREIPKSCLFFSGMCGNGKTTWLKAIRTLINSLNLRHPQTNSSYSVSLWNARELAYRCKDEYQEWARIARLPILAIDDFGTDPKEIISFGNCLTPMIDLITKRYEEQLFTLFTTNLTFSQIKEKYEERIADRLIEMVVPIRFGNGSYRS